MQWMSSQHLQFSTQERCMADKRACLTKKQNKKKNVCNAVIKVINLIDKNTSKLLTSPHQ